MGLDMILFLCRWAMTLPLENLSLTQKIKSAIERMR